MIRSTAYKLAMLSVAFTASNCFAGSEADYKIIKDQQGANGKRVVEVLLPERVEEDALESIAKTIRAGGGEKLQQTLIGYRIQGSETSGFWARSDFTPNLNVVILGTTASESQKLNDSLTTEAPGEVIGRWRPDWGVEYIATLYRDKSKTYLSATYSDGSHSAEEMTETMTGSGLRIEKSGSKTDSDYYIVNSNGELEFWDAEGKYYTAPTAK